MTHFTSIPDVMTIQSLWELYRTDRLIIQPPYQRRTVWPLSSKLLLIDSIYANYDIPKIYLRQRAADTGEVFYEVIDGQQRLRSLFDFRNGDLILNPILMPMSETSEQRIKFCDILIVFVEDFIRENEESPSFDNLLVQLKTRFNQFRLNIVTVDTDDDFHIKELFSRLNRNVVKPSIQDLRHAAYSGTNILNTISKLSYYPQNIPISRIEYDPGPTNSFLINNGICFSSHINKRRDEEFTAELLYLIVEQKAMDKKKKLDEFFLQYRDSINHDGLEAQKFIDVLEEIERLFPQNNLRNTRFTNFTDFYLLFWVVHILKNGYTDSNNELKTFPYDTDISTIIKQIVEEISDGTNGRIENLAEPYRTYKEKSQQAGDIRDSRVWKFEFFMEKIKMSFDGNQQRQNSFEEFISSFNQDLTDT